MPIFGSAASDEELEARVRPVRDASAAEAELDKRAREKADREAAEAEAKAAKEREAEIVRLRKVAGEAGRGIETLEGVLARHLADVAIVVHAIEASMAERDEALSTVARIEGRAFAGRGAYALPAILDDRGVGSRSAKLFLDAVGELPYGREIGARLCAIPVLVGSPDRMARAGRSISVGENFGPVPPNPLPRTK